MNMVAGADSSDASRRQWSSRLIKNAVALMVSAGGTAVLGIAFWGLAAHLASAASLGRSSAEIAVMILLANLSQLSFGSIFERFLPVAGLETRRFIKRAYAMCTVTAFVLAIVYVFSGLGRNVVPRSFLWHVFFIVVVVMWTIFVLQDNVLVGLRASRWVPVENILFAMTKLAALPALIAFSASQGIFLAWSAPVILTIIAVNWYLFTRRIPEHEALRSPSESLPKTRELFLLAGAQYATVLFSIFTPTIVSLIVIQRLGAVANAYWYIPGLITSGLSMFNISINRSFLVEAASEPHFMRRHANTAVRAMTVVIVPSVIIGVAFAPEFLRIFGPQYSIHGTTLLRMLLLSLPLGSFSLFYSTFAWLERRVWWLTVRSLVSVIIYFSLVFSLIGRFGIEAMGIASLVSSGLQGIFFLPISIRRYRSTTNVEAPPHDDVMM